MMNERVGIIHNDHVQYPTLTLGGRPVSLPCRTVIGLGQNRFVFRDDYPWYDVNEALDALNKALEAEEKGNDNEQHGKQRKGV
ncbi:MAG: hypothetical protein EBR82_55355 [Caulobacteraceae bacterium]|nr:hypothetical protein [Caulobacteraceae bacterium]